MVRALTACVLFSCATPAQTEKGGLKTVSIDPAALDNAYRPRRFALVLGIERGADDGFRPLKFAEKDASDFGAALSDAKLGHFDDVRRLTAREQTTREGVLAALKQLAARANRPDDVVVVYVSAHGTLARDERGVLRRYLVTSDAKMRSVHDTALSMEALKEAFDTLPSRRRLLVLATCHSGTGKSLLPPQVQQELMTLKAGFYAPPLEQASRAAVVLSASDWGEPAREDESLQNDIYTHFLIDALQGAGDRNGDGAVTATEAHDHARRRTWAFTQGRQRPSAEILEVGADPIVLAGSLERLGRPELYSYSARLDGFALKVDGEEKGELPGGTAVAPGKRAVELTKGGVTLLSSTVTVEEGERLDLDELVRETEPRRLVSLGGGVFGFLGAVERQQLLPAVPTAGASFTLERPFDAPLAAHVGLLGSAGRRTLQVNAPFDYRLVSVSLGLDWLMQWRWLQVFLGPQVAALWLSRSFDLETFVGTQNVFTATLGVSAGVGVVMLERWELFVRAQTMFAFMVVDGESRAFGFAGGSAGLGYRF